MAAGERQLASVALAIFGIIRGSGGAVRLHVEEYLFADFGRTIRSFFQAMKPQTASPPQLENRTLAAPSSRSHSPVTSPAIATDVVRIASPAKQARVIRFSISGPAHVPDCANRRQAVAAEAEVRADKTQIRRDESPIRRNKDKIGGRKSKLF
jgi:hypothetical protein